MPVTLSVPQGEPEFEERLRRQLATLRRQLPFDAEWSVLVWRTQDGFAWNVFVRGPTGVASEALENLDDERALVKLLRLLLRTSQTQTSDRKAG